MIARGRYAGRLALSDADVARAQRLRHLCFVLAAGRPAAADGLDRDAYDPLCQHLLVEDETGALVACCRLMLLGQARDIGQSYSAQFYDLSRLAGFAGPILEIGRFCVLPDHHDPDILRVAWGALTRIVDGQGVTLMFGCSSFAGTSPAPYEAGLALLAARHTAPADWAPSRKAAEVVALPCIEVPDAMAGLRQIPPLLRTYLAMGGWVSDHAVIDRTMHTLHVFTGVEIAKVPPARARALRNVAAV